VDNVTAAVALPGAGHFIHYHQATFVTRQIEAWVDRPLSAYKRLG